MTYIHPDLAYLAEGADDPRAAALALPVLIVAGAVIYTAEQAAEMVAKLRAELAALHGIHPVKRARIRAELAALDAFLNMADTIAGTDDGWEHHAGDTPTAGPAGGPAPWEPPAPGWEVGP